MLPKSKCVTDRVEEFALLTAQKFILSMFCVTVAHGFIVTYCFTVHLVSHSVLS